MKAPATLRAPLLIFFHHPVADITTLPTCSYVAVTTFKIQLTRSQAVARIADCTAKSCMGHV